MTRICRQPDAVELKESLERQLAQRGMRESAPGDGGSGPGADRRFRLLTDWTRAFLTDAGKGDRLEYAEEVAALLMPNLNVKWTPSLRVSSES